MKRMGLCVGLVTAMLAGCVPSPCVSIIHDVGIHLTAVIEPTLAGAPWDADGSPPDVMFLVGGAGSLTPGRQVVEGYTVSFEEFSDGTASSALRSYTVTLLDVDTNTAADVVASRHHVTVLPVDEARGSIHLDAVEGLAGLDFTFRYLDGFYQILPGIPGVAPLNGTLPWDRDGTPPDLAVTVECRDATVTSLVGSQYEDSYHAWSALPCNTSTDDVLANGFSYSVEDQDLFEVVAGPVTFTVTDADLQRGFIELGPVGRATSLRVEFRRHDLPNCA